VPVSRSACSMSCSASILSTMPEPKLYVFSTTIGVACAPQFISFQELAEKLKMDVTDLMRQCNGKMPPSKALVEAWPGSWTSTSRSWKNWQKRSGKTWRRSDQAQCSR
jgi:hypothetical protein